MHTQFFQKVGNALLIAALLAGLTFATAFAGDDAQVICEGNGGIWTGGTASNGDCYYPFNHAFTINNCGAPSNVVYRVEYNANTEVGTFCDYFAIVTSDFSELTCALWDGDFGPDPSNATCTITHDYFGDCPSTTIYHSQFVLTSYMTTHFECTGGSGGSSASGGGSGQQSGNPGFGNYGGKIKTDRTGSAQLGGNKNGSFHYDAGTCAAGCIYSPNLPGGAANSLPDGVVATLYVRLADDGAGSYTVCFDVAGISSPMIYRYISGAWVAQPLTFTGGQVCTSASGDGAFALGG